MAPASLKSTSLLKSISPGNYLINLLPKKDRLRLMAACDLVDLAFAEVLSDPGKPTQYVYFPTAGFISLIALVKGSPGVEVGMVGREGMLGVQLALGVATAPLHALVQGEGKALRISTKAFKAELSASPALQSALLRYLYVLMAQLAESTACVRFHPIGPRLARWLLMRQARSQASSFDVTQAFLAYMLGVRRVGVTTAAGALQKSGLISYSRGKLTVLNRKGLERAACGCFLADQKTYAELL
jgi:CRP-like cAMP-binding protein